MEILYPRVIVTEVRDGATCICDIDMGFDQWKMNQKISLSGIVVPQMQKDKQSPGKKAHLFLKQKICDQTVTLKTERKIINKREKYFATIWLDDNNINDLMIAEGHAQNIEVQDETA